MGDQRPTCGSCGAVYPYRVASRTTGGIGYAEECTLEGAA